MRSWPGTLRLTFLLLTFTWRTGRGETHEENGCIATKAQLSGYATFELFYLLHSLSTILENLTKREFDWQHISSSRPGYCTTRLDTLVRPLNMRMFETRSIGILLKATSHHQRPPRSWNHKSYTFCCITTYRLVANSNSPAKAPCRP